jgi:dihydroorotate dehydrogenase electron transfer subunit
MENESKPSAQLWTVADNVRICAEHLRLTLRAASFAEAGPGQFVTLAPARSAQTHVQGSEPFYLRRAFSIAGLRRDPSRVELDLLYRVVGAATSWMAQLRIGQAVSIVGPLGNRFRVPAIPVQAWLAAGGIGLPPVLWLAERLRAAGIDVTAFCGARTASLLPLTIDPAADVPRNARSAVPCAAEFARYQIPVVVCTDDGSLGFRGNVVDAVQAYQHAQAVQTENLVVYACGPEPMLEAVASWANAAEIQCYLCMERAMACGVGTCQSCVVPVKNRSAEDGWQYQLCCTEGPVFDGKSVLWKLPVAGSCDAP